MAKNKKLWIDMCAGSELKDTQGETLSVDGADISELEKGEGRLNDNHGKGFFNSLGRVTEAKKIFKAEDCENERHQYYWEKIKAPFIYAKGYLYSDDDHPNARAAAAILRNIHREDTPLKMKASVEGGVLSRGIKDPTRLAHTKIHSVALTFTPANNATLVEPLNIDKSNSDWTEDKQLIKSVMHLAETNVPSFRHIQRHASAHTIYENINKIQELAKSVGIEIMIKQDIDPNTIMEKAVLNKVSTNISKINYLIKSAAKKIDPIVSQPSSDTATKPTPAKEAYAQNRAEKQLQNKNRFEQGIERLKSDPTTPQKPIDSSSSSKDIMRVKPAQQVKLDNQFKMHASRAMRDPQYLNSIEGDLINRGISANKINAIMTRIKSHIPESIGKSNQDIEKGDLGRAAKNLAVAGMMGLAVNEMGADSKDKTKEVKPKKQIERSIASKPKSKRFGNDEYMNRLDDTARARADKVKAKYSKAKDKLKKALMAGYGGAGAPTDLSGGGIFQTESLDSGRAKKADDEFKYINCDNCGHEQVYMDHQVKCRKCRQNFNLNKLEDFI